MIKKEIEIGTSKGKPSLGRIIKAIISEREKLKNDI